jgi:hypothetical protein
MSNTIRHMASQGLIKLATPFVTQVIPDRVAADNALAETEDRAEWAKVSEESCTPAKKPEFPPKQFRKNFFSASIGDFLLSRGSAGTLFECIPLLVGITSHPTFGFGDSESPRPRRNPVGGPRSWIILEMAPNSKKRRIPKNFWRSPIFGEDLHLSELQKWVSEKYVPNFQKCTPKNLRKIPQHHVLLTLPFGLKKCISAATADFFTNKKALSADELIFRIENRNLEDFFEAKPQWNPTFSGFSFWVF